VNAAAGSGSEKDSFASILLQGKYSDYSSEWYGLVGYSITQTMIINAFMPLINEVIVALTKHFGIKRDQGFEKDKRIA
jgi:hypothetical protein